MKKDRIIINKSLIPYRFSIVLANESFDLQISYNESADLFTITLFKENEIICSNEPIIYGVPLFKDVYVLDKYPALEIVPIDSSGQENKVTWNNFGVTVFLEINNTGDNENE